MNFWFSLNCMTIQVWRNLSLLRVRWDFNIYNCTDSLLVSLYFVALWGDKECAEMLIFIIFSGFWGESKFCSNLSSLVVGWDLNIYAAPGELYKNRIWVNSDGVSHALTFDYLRFYWGVLHAKWRRQISGWREFILELIFFLWRRAYQAHWIVGRFAKADFDF